MAAGKLNTEGIAEDEESSEIELMGFEAALELGSSKMDAINWRREREKLRRWKEERGWSTANC